MLSRFLALLLVAAPTVLATAPEALAAGWRVAVLDFDNAAPDPEWDALGKGMQSMLTTDMAELASVRSDLQVVERARLADIQSELNLGKKGALDPATAAKIGKLTGATHLVAGSFTVVGKTLRLDARLIAVASGDVTTTAKIEGDKDAFFELEKDLVKRLVDGIGMKLEPKERAKLTTVQTADLEAFRAYSEGLAQFEAKRYDEALTALRKAAQIDGNFALARQTLADYERLAADARGHAQAAHHAEDERAKLLAAAATAWDKAMLDQLVRIHESAKDPVDRAVAAWLLGDFFNPDRAPSDRFRSLHDTGDAFALNRMSDRWVATYVAEATALGGKVAPLPFGTLYGVLPWPADMDKAFRPWFAKARELASGQRCGSDVSYALAHIGVQLQMDTSERLALHERIVRDCDAKWTKEVRLRERLRLGDNLLKFAFTDRAARVFTEARTLTDDAKTLDKIAQQLEWGRDLLAELQKSDPLQRFRREFAALRGSDPPIHGIRLLQKEFTGSTLGEKALRELQHVRQITKEREGEAFVWLDSVVFFPLVSDRAAVWHAAAVNRERGSGLRYFVDKLPKSGLPFFLGVLGDTARDAFSVSLTLDYRPASDWRPVYKAESREQPDVTIAFGLENLAAKAPLAGWGVRVGPSGVALVKVLPDDKSRGGYSNHVLVTPLEKAGLAPRSDKSAVTVTLGKGGVDVTVDGRSHHFTLPGKVAGFPGLVISGAGYVQVDTLRLR